MQQKGNFLFVSIFYGKEKWGELLQIIKDEVLCNQNIAAQLTGAYVFLSESRGEHIRVALEFNSRDFKLQHNEILMPIRHFINDHPTTRESAFAPISRFFCDFPNNEIKYNLYNEGVFMPGGLREIQMLVSGIVLTYFEDKPVNEKSLCTLLMTLQEIILDALCDTEESKLKLINEILLDIKTGESNTSPDTGEEESFVLDYSVNDCTRQSHLEELLLFLRSVSAELLATYRQAKTVYKILLKIFRSNLSCASEETIKKSLCTIQEYLTMDETPDKNSYQLFNECISIY